MTWIIFSKAGSISSNQINMNGSILLEWIKCIDNQLVAKNRWTVFKFFFKSLTKPVWIVETCRICNFRNG